MDGGSAVVSCQLVEYQDGVSNIKIFEYLDNNFFADYSIRRFPKPNENLDSDYLLIDSLTYLVKR